VYRKSFDLLRFQIRLSGFETTIESDFFPNRAEEDKVALRLHKFMAVHGNLNSSFFTALARITSIKRQPGALLGS
jgi:hypothetical protein